MSLGLKDPHSLAAEIMMTRTNCDGVLLVLEGKSDKRFWSPRCHSTCELIDGEGKANVIGSIENLDCKGFKGALGIVDDDYDSLIGGVLASKNLVTTGVHDLECILFQSSALTMTLSEFGSEEKIEKFENDAGVDVRTALLNRAVVIGRIRWAAIQFELGIDPQMIRIPQFLDEDTWTLDEGNLFHSVVTDRPPDFGEMLRDRIAQLPSADPWCIARGHDMLEIFRIGLKRVLGNLMSNVGTDHICQVLRASMPLQELKATAIGRDIRRWETSNQGIPVFG